MKRAVAIFVFCVCVMPARAADISIALTNENIEVDTNFAGARFTLFGAVTGIDNPQSDIDIISVIRGPATEFKIRQIEKRSIIWTPGDAHTIPQAPGLYLTNATRPITDIAPLPDQAKFRLGADFLAVRATRSNEAGENPEHDQLFADAFLQEAKSSALYQDRVGGIEFEKGALFKINVDLPADTPVGVYDVSVYLYQDGVLLGSDIAELDVNKVGMERQIYDLAHQRPLTYGVLCVALSLFAGWIASLAFRK